MTRHMLIAFSNRALVVGWVLGCVSIGLPVSAEGAGADRAGIFDEEAEIQSSPDSQEVNVGSFGQVDLHVKDLEISQVLQLLGLQSERNIIASRNVAGSISADLYGVDFYEALDAILHTNGFGYQEKGNLIFIYTTAELEAIQEAQRKVIHRIVRLNYITAADASAFVTPLLSTAGSLSVSSDVSAGFQPSIGDGGANSFAYSDTMIVHDYAENVDEIVAVIKELDKRPKQVLVEATILTASLKERNSFGIDLSVLADFALDKFLDPLGVVDEVISGVTPLNNSSAAASTTVGNTGTGSAGVKVGIVTNNVAAFIRALDDVTDATIIANPKILVLNRQKADLLVGGKKGYLSSTSTDTSTTQTVEFLEIGTQLTLRPFVSDDGFIRMELRPSISDGTISLLGSSVIPETTNQELTTNVVVRSGQTVVLGGLFKEDTTVARSQVPGLGDIPILGALFKGRDDTVNRDEVIFMITPTIIKDESLNKIGDRMGDTIEMVRLGARKGLLPWSRTKMISSHLRIAQRFFEEGDSQKALWSTNLALAVEPMSPEAIRMKAMLTAQNAYPAANLSVLQEAVDKVIRKKMDFSDVPENSDGSQSSSELMIPMLPSDPADSTQPVESALLDSEEVYSDIDSVEDLIDAALEDESSLNTESVDPEIDDFEEETVWQDNAIEVDTDDDVWSWAKNLLDPQNSDDDPTDSNQSLPQTTFDPDTVQEVETSYVEEPDFEEPVVVVAVVDSETDFTDHELEDAGDVMDWGEVELEDTVQDELYQEAVDSEPQPQFDELQVDEAESFSGEWSIDDEISEVDDQGFDDDDAHIPAIDDEFSIVDEVIDSISTEFDDEGGSDPVLDEDWSDYDEVDFDIVDLEWDEEAYVTPALDEPFDSENEGVDLESNGYEDPDRLQFVPDQVGTSDPFNAVVEWLLPSDHSQGNESSR